MMRVQAPKPWDKKLDVFLVGIVAAVFLLVLAAQVYLAGDPYSQSAETVMSREFTRSTNVTAGGDLNKPVVTFKLKDFSSLPLARLLVNGEHGGVFSDRYVTVFVSDGDVLAIDGTRYSRPFEIEVLDVSRGVEQPRPGLSIKVNGSVGNIGVVRVSR